jgi:hypothetical protein
MNAIRTTSLATAAPLAQAVSAAEKKSARTLKRCIATSI